MEAIAPLDRFGEKGHKLRFLLGIPGGARVLLAGPGVRDWAGDFGNCFRECRVLPSLADPSLAEAGSAGYDLAVWAVGEDDGGRRLAGGLAALRRVLAPGGHLLLFAPNRLDVERVARNPLGLFTRPSHTDGGYRRRLEGAGFGRVRRFLPLPGLREMEECVDPGAGEVWLPSYAPRLVRAASAAGLFHHVHEGFVYLASPEGSGLDATLAALRRHVAEASSCVPGELRLERFDLRDRGALVLLLRDDASGRRYACRIAADGEVAAVVGRNAEWVRRIHREPRISPAVRERVPEPVAEFPFRGGTAYVESLCEGAIAWKVALRAEVRVPLFAGVYGFLRDLNRQTASPRILDDAVLRGLLDDGPEERRRGLDAGVGEEMDALRSLLRGRLLGEERTLVWAHGDFGYGNAVVAPDGRLSGIIDWDCARGEELAGVDLLNLLVQTRRTETRASLDDAVRTVAELVVDGGFAAAAPGVDYDAHFPADRERRTELAALFCLRALCRLARYPRIFARDRAAHLELLRWACGLLETGAAARS